MARTKYPCTPEKFTEVWQQATCSDEAAQILGMPKPIMFARAAGYRALGVKLKKMPYRRRDKVNVEGLNQLIERLGPSGPAQEHTEDSGSFAF
jgi:hypothetical protein